MPLSALSAASTAASLLELACAAKPRHAVWPPPLHRRLCALCAARGRRSSCDRVATTDCLVVRLRTPLSAPLALAHQHLRRVRGAADVVVVCVRLSAAVSPSMSLVGGLSSEPPDEQLSHSVISHSFWPYGSFGGVPLGSGVRVTAGEISARPPLGTCRRPSDTTNHFTRWCRRVANTQLRFARVRGVAQQSQTSAARSLFARRGRHIQQPRAFFSSFRRPRS